MKDTNSRYWVFAEELEIVRAKKKVDKGDYPGHPFRGNQWTKNKGQKPVLGEYGGLRGSVGKEIDEALEALGVDIAEGVDGHVLVDGGDMYTSTAPSYLTRAMFEVTVGGLSTKVTSVTGDMEYATVEGNVVDKSGNKVGEFRRNITFEGGGITSVEHNYFSVWEGQGSGLGTEFFNRSVAAYEHLGVLNVTTHANIDIGGYAWAKAGFDFDTPYTRQSMIREMSNKAGEWSVSGKASLKREVVFQLGLGRITRIPADAYPNEPKLRRAIGEAQKAIKLIEKGVAAKWSKPFLEDVAARASKLDSNTATPLEIASLGIEKAIKVRVPILITSGRNPRVEYTEMSIWPGKLFMLGSDWYGVLPLS